MSFSEYVAGIERELGRPLDDGEYDAVCEGFADAEFDMACHRDEYQPWETPEWFTEGPGSVTDPRHSQGYSAGYGR